MSDIDPKEARARVQKWWNDPKHHGKPEDDEKTRDDDLDDPKHQDKGGHDE